MHVSIQFFDKHDMEINRRKACTDESLFMFKSMNLQRALIFLWPCCTTGGKYAVIILAIEFGYQRAGTGAVCWFICTRRH
jgi:23S rRNA A2030 N6-methylase RlmJ